MPHQCFCTSKICGRGEPVQHHNSVHGRRSCSARLVAGWSACAAGASRCMGRQAGSLKRTHPVDNLEGLPPREAAIPDGGQAGGAGLPPRPAQQQRKSRCLSAVLQGGNWLAPAMHIMHGNFPRCHPQLPGVAPTFHPPSAAVCGAAGPAAGGRGKSSAACPARPHSLQVSVAQAQLLGCLLAARFWWRQCTCLARPHALPAASSPRVKVV